MNWNKIFKEAAKSALIFAAVGALLAVAAPAIGGLVGMTEVGAAANIGWQAAFFGMFGALNAVVAPVISNAIGSRDEEEKKNVTVNLTVATPAIHHGHNLSITNNDIDVQQDVNVLAVDASHTKNMGVDAHTKNVIKDNTMNAVALTEVKAEGFVAGEEQRRAKRESILLGGNQIVH